MNKRKAKRKAAGNAATEQDYLNVKWEPWKLDGAGRKLVSAECIDELGVAARMAFVGMCQSREQTVQAILGWEREPGAKFDDYLAMFKTARERLQALSGIVAAAEGRLLAAAHTAYASIDQPHAH